MKNALIIGCGLSGAVLARRLADSGKLSKIVVVDRRSHIGGNCYDYFDGGIPVQKYGAHIFHTDNERVWNFLRRFTDFDNYTHRVAACVDGFLIPLPFSLTSLRAVFPESLAKKLEEKLLALFRYGEKISILDFKKFQDPDISFLAGFIYKKVFAGYSKKQWGTVPEEISPAVLARVPVLIGRDTRYFQDRYQGMPSKGYTRMIAVMLQHPRIKVRLRTPAAAVRGAFSLKFSTGSIDEYFAYKHGVLPYRSLRFEFSKYRTAFFQEAPVVNYPENHDFTRIIEFKHFYPHIKASATVVAREFPGECTPGVDEPFYPVENAASAALYRKYLDEAKTAGVTFLGRLGDYTYYNMDRAAARAMETADKVEKEL